MSTPGDLLDALGREARSRLGSARGALGGGEGVRTYRGRTVEELIPRIERELGADAIILRRREGLAGGMFGFFQHQYVELEAMPGTPRLDVYDDDIDQDLDDADDLDGPFVPDTPGGQPAPARSSAPTPQPPAREFAPPRRVPTPSAARASREARGTPVPRARTVPVQSLPLESSLLESQPLGRPAPEPPPMRAAPRPAAQASPPPPAPSSASGARVPSPAAALDALLERSASPQPPPVDAIPEPEPFYSRDPGRSFAETGPRPYLTAHFASLARAAAPPAGAQPASGMPPSGVPPRQPPPTRYEPPSPYDPAPRYDRAPSYDPPPYDPSPAYEAGPAYDPAPPPSAAPTHHPAPAPAPVRGHESPPARESPVGAEREPAPRVDFQELLPRDLSPPVSAPEQPSEGERRSVAPGSHARARAGVEKSLRRFGVGEQLADELIETAIAHVLPLAPRSGLAQAVRMTLAQRIPVAPPLPLQGAALVVVGAGGSGKTTCCRALLEAYREGSTMSARYATVTREHRRGALQLLMAPQIMKPAAAGSTRALRALRRARGDGLAVLDTPSVSPADRTGIRELGALLGEMEPERTVVALPATLGAAAAAQLLEALTPLGAHALAVTHADETDQIGVAIEAACAFGLAPEYMLDRSRAGAWRLTRVDPATLVARILP